MNPQEQTLLQDVLNRLAQTPSPVRDPQAETLIHQSLGARPDALYVMTQVVVMQDLAVKQLQQQVGDLQQKVAAQPQTSNSFLGGFGPAAAAQAQPAPSRIPPTSFGPAPTQQAPAGGGFFQNMMTTAAGVVAGEVAFSALHSLFSGGASSHPAMSQGGGLWGSGAEHPAVPPASETTINNYYGDAAPVEDGASDFDTDLGDAGSDYDDSSI